MEALRDEGSHSEHGRWIPGQEGSPGDTVGPLRGESLTVSMGGSGRMGIVPGEQGVSPENKREISGDGRIIRMERCHEGVVSGEESPDSQALWGSDPDPWECGGMVIGPLTGWGWRQRSARAARHSCGPAALRGRAPSAQQSSRHPPGQLWGSNT